MLKYGSALNKSQVFTLKSKGDLVHR